jgi:transposase, IS5 family
MRWFRGVSWKHLSNRSIQRLARVVSQLGCQSCFATTFCSNGLISPILAPRMLCTNLRCFGVLRGLIWAVLPRPTRLRFFVFRRLLEQHELCGKILDAVNHYLASKGLRISTGTIVDATIIAAPSSTKNSTGERDLEMHQTRKGNQWHFGAKAHIGVDSKEAIVHSVCTSAASVSDVHMLPDLPHGAEKKVWGDAGYQGQGEAIHAAAPEAQDMTSRRTKRKDSVDEVERRKNRTKVRVRAKVEWPFSILKRVFGYTKVRYRGLKKNHEWLLAAFALVNLYQHRNRLVTLGA